MGRLDLLILLAIVALRPLGALADAPAAACLAPLALDDPDPQPRDVRITVARNKPEATVTACIVSNQDASSQIGATVQLFDRDKRSFVSAPLNYGHWTGTDSTGDAPKRIIAARTTVPIGGSNARRLQREAQVTISWSSCGRLVSGDPCGSAGAVGHSATFLRPILSITRDGSRPAPPAHPAKGGATLLCTGGDPAPESAGATIMHSGNALTLTGSGQIVSCLHPGATIEVSFAFFTADGALLTVTGAGPSGAPDGNAQNYTATIPIAAADAARLSGKMLVALDWSTCDASSASSCIKPTYHMQSYLKDVAIK